MYVHGGYTPFFSPCANLLAHIDRALSEFPPKAPYLPIIIPYKRAPRLLLVNITVHTWGKKYVAMTISYTGLEYSTETCTIIC